jgi:S1-C subfamily serine protease
MATTSSSLSQALTEAARTVLAAAGPSVVRIGRHGGRGCGVVVADGHVLTNAHNLRDRTTEVTFADGRAVQASVVAADVDGDLVLVAADTAGAPPLVWADAPAEVGSVAYAVARTASGGARLTVGLVSSVEGAFRGPRGRRVSGTLEHTAPLARGSSGSPIVDEEGRLLGLNTARLGQGFYVALPADADLRQRVDALLRGESPRRRMLGIGVAPSEVAAKLRASVGLPERSGLLVRSLATEGPASAAGVQVGDLISGAGGTPIATVDDLHQALDAAGDTLELQLVRGAEDLTVTVTFAAPEEAAPADEGGEGEGV